VEFHRNEEERVSLDGGGDEYSLPDRLILCGKRYNPEPKKNMMSA